ncbi:MAG TPA: GntR family transcriptional regulator [Pseudonocardia sp.]|uniref:GntR family transcriptional regulator n=1 Tax=Pseudonocardia sp. TaxID=60912 RepID=UPI002CA1C35B|nr:GntR family transcriptional regulator [Pseudonocardia sp.]HTF52405.1 GntR family transcriptional regulator [Pseudonocardia sp.]
MTAARGLGPGVAYQSLAQLLRDAINQGSFANGRQLPTEAELVADYGVSRQTVRRALQELVAEGLVSRVRGHGTFEIISVFVLCQGGQRPRLLTGVGWWPSERTLAADRVVPTSAVPALRPALPRGRATPAGSGCP